MNNAVDLASRTLIANIPRMSVTRNTFLFEYYSISLPPNILPRKFPTKNRQLATDK